MIENKYIVIQDDVVVAYANSKADAETAVSVLAEKQKLKLMLNKKLLKKFLKKNLPLNTSDFKIAVILDRGDQS